MKSAFFSSLQNLCEKGTSPNYSQFVTVQSFALLLTAAETDAQLEALGELMFQVIMCPVSGIS
jgi:hypothetical protein